MVLGTLVYIIIIIIVVIVIIALLQILVGLFFVAAPALAEINLDADLMNIYPDPGKPITILSEDNSAGITVAAATAK